MYEASKFTQSSPLFVRCFRSSAVRAFLLDGMKGRDQFHTNKIVKRITLIIRTYLAVYCTCELKSAKQGKRKLHTVQTHPLCVGVCVCRVQSQRFPNSLQGVRESGRVMGYGPELRDDEERGVRGWDGEDGRRTAIRRNKLWVWPLFARTC